MLKTCSACRSHSGMTRFANETFTIAHADMKTKVEGLSGWRCEGCGEVEFDTRSSRHYAQAGDALVIRDRSMRGKMFRGVRSKPGSYAPAQLAERSLAEDWLRPEEDAAWANLQPDK